MFDNPLMALVATRRDELGLSYGQIAVRARMSKSTLHKVATTSQWVSMPRTATLTALAAGLNLPVATVLQAAAEAVGVFAPSPPPTQERMLVANIHALAPEQRGMVAALVNEMLRTQREAGNDGTPGGQSGAVSGDPRPG